MVNEDYVPDAVEDAVIDVLHREKRANPYLIREQTEDLSKQQINNALSNLTAAGWVRKPTRGLYDYVSDPRRLKEVDRDDSEVPDAALRARELLDGWEPDDQVNTARARDAAGDVVEWLATQDQPQERRDVIEWAEAGNHYFASSTLWEKVAQPALGYLKEEGVVRFTANVGYEIVD